MNLEIIDIDFSLIEDYRVFEELCFDLLLQLGFKSIKWRRGGADNGRDIEAIYYHNNPLVDFHERWFFECKFFSEGVPPEKLYSKIAWADAERPNHYVFFIKPYLTNQSNEWLEKIKQQKNYLIHVVEEKMLKELIYKYPSLIEKYFLTKNMKLLKSVKEMWLIHDSIPDIKLIEYMVNDINYRNFTNSDIVFLILSSRLRDEELDEWHDENYFFSMEPLCELSIERSSKSRNPLLLELIEHIKFEKIHYQAYMYDLERPFVKELLGIIRNGSNKGLYCFGINHNGDGLEYYLDANSDFNAEIRCFLNKGTEIMQQIEDSVYK